jgi:hypothetical protein
VKNADGGCRYRIDLRVSALSRSHCRWFFASHQHRNKMPEDEL